MIAGGRVAFLLSSFFFPNKHVLTYTNDEEPVGTVLAPMAYFLPLLISVAFGVTFWGLWLQSD